MKFINFLSLIVASLLASSSVQAADSAGHDFQKDQPISNQQCISCHQQSHDKWQQSDHAKAMAIADKNSVLANFENVDVKHYGQKTHFFIKDNRYQVKIL